MISANTLHWKFLIHVYNFSLYNVILVSRTLISSIHPWLSRDPWCNPKKKIHGLIAHWKVSFMCMSDIRKLACLQNSIVWYKKIGMFAKLHCSKKDENWVPIFLYFILCKQWNKLVYLFGKDTIKPLSIIRKYKY